MAASSSGVGPGGGGGVQAIQNMPLATMAGTTKDENRTRFMTNSFQEWMNK